MLWTLMIASLESKKICCQRFAQTLLETCVKQWDCFDTYIFHSTKSRLSRQFQFRLHSMTAITDCTV